MLTVISKTIIFISSYIPLYIILFVQYCDFSKNLLKQPLLVTLLSIIILSSFMLILFIKYISSTNNIIKTIEVRNVKKLKESNLTYLLSNIIPLIAFDFNIILAEIHKLQSVILIFTKNKMIQKK